MHSQAFEVSGYLARGQARELVLDVEMAKAGDHVLAAYQSEQERPVIVAEEVDAHRLPAQVSHVRCIEHR